MRYPVRQKARPKKSYSIAYLLSRQPKTLKKDPLYPRMMEQYRTSERLQKVRFSRRCYSLLNKGRIAPENLRYFYRTYKLPKDPFFPLFFMIKRNYEDRRVKLQEARRLYIASRMRGLSPQVLNFIKYLAEVEKGYNSRGKYPYWNTHLFPKTKKAVEEYGKFSIYDWIDFFADYLEGLKLRYGAFPAEGPGRLVSCFVLDLLPRKGEPIDRPGADEVRRQYRKLSKIHHPDTGGDPRLFVLLKDARDRLLA